jgi:hypothetical protein
VTPDEKIMIYANLDYAGLDGEGNFHLILVKDTEDLGINKILMDMLRDMVEQDVCVTVCPMYKGGAE